VLATQAAPGANAEERVAPERNAKRSAPASLEARLAEKLGAVRRHRRTIHFFEKHPALLHRAETRARARAVLRKAERRLTAAETAVARLRRAIARKETRRLASLRPRAAICDVFGSDCEEAIAVAWCESRLTTTARNGQYLGLFQMGSYARSLFGHGSTAHAQARAAHRYFVVSGRDWSPWSCRWAAS